MDWHRLAWIVGPAIAVAILTWFGGTIVKNWLEGTPLNGLRKLFGKSTAPSKKTSLSVIVLTAPEPKWHVRATGKEPMLNLSIHANLAHKSNIPLEIVKAYVKGTKPVGVFFPFIVAGPYDEPSLIHFSVRPIIVQDMDRLMRRVILVVSTTTSNFMIGVIAAASAGIYLSRGYIDPQIAMPVMLGVLGGSLIATHFLIKAKVKTSKLLFAIVTVLLGGEMIFNGITGRV